MAFRRDSRPAPDQIEAVIGQRATFDGKLRCDGSVRIDGTVEAGTIETLGNVLITETARVMADIKAKSVSVAGAFKGIIVADRVELLEGGRLWGTITVKSFLLDEGAYFDGKLVMVGAKSDEAPVPSQPDSAGQIPVETAAAADQLAAPARSRLPTEEALTRSRFLSVDEEPGGGKHRDDR